MARSESLMPSGEPGAQTSDPDDLIPGLRILLVDDEPVVRQILCVYLVADGHAVTAAANGHEALEQFAQRTFDVVITDDAMPNMSGEQLAARIKDACPGVPVVLMTGFAVPGANLPLKTRTVDLAIQKPVGRADLRKALGWLARQHHAASDDGTSRPNSAD